MPKKVQTRAQPKAKKLSPREERKARRRFRKRLIRYMAIGGVTMVGILVIISLVLPNLPTGGRATGEEAPGPGTRVPIVSKEHIPQGQAAPANAYNTIPPTSGLHWPEAARCGIYDNPISNEGQVHSLEHGFVFIQYRNAEDQELVRKLKALVESLPNSPNWLILAPYPRMDSTIALTAWGVIQYLDDYDEAAIKAFAEAYRGKGPEQDAPSC